jgi:hypothetical protein
MYDGIRRNELIPLATNLQMSGITKFDPKRMANTRATRDLTTEDKAEWWLGEFVDIVTANKDDINLQIQLRVLRNFGDQLILASS